MRLALASRNYGRNLVADVEATGALHAGAQAGIERASTTLHNSVEVMAVALTGSRDVTYTRSSALFEWAEHQLDECPGVPDGGHLAIRDLKLIDGAMARMAEVMGLHIADYDTSAGPPIKTGPATLQ
jgi:hypothetical protein